MKITTFPYIAAGVGILLMLLVMQGSKTNVDGVTQIPLLTLLIVSEFAFFVSAFGAYIGFKQIRLSGIKPLYLATSLFCALMAIRFMWLGIELWPL